MCKHSANVRFNVHVCLRHVVNIMPIKLVKLTLKNRWIIDNVLQVLGVDNPTIVWKHKPIPSLSPLWIYIYVSERCNSMTTVPRAQPSPSLLFEGVTCPYLSNQTPAAILSTSIIKLSLRREKFRSWLIYSFESNSIANKLAT